MDWHYRNRWREAKSNVTTDAAVYRAFMLLCCIVQQLRGRLGRCCLTRCPGSLGGQVRSGV